MSSDDPKSLPPLEDSGRYLKKKTTYEPWLHSSPNGFSNANLAATDVHQYQRIGTSRYPRSGKDFVLLNMTSKMAETAVQAIKRELERRGKAAVIAVADAHGELMALLRLDGAPLPSILIATNKAWTAARQRKTTREIGQAVRDPVKGYDITYFGDPRYVGWGGGVPVVLGTHVIGAVAVSGLSQEEDEELAKIGIEAIKELQ